MKLIRISLAVVAITMAGCVSWVFAKGPFNEMPEGTYSVDLTHASIVWKVSHFGLSNYVARFTDFDANIEYDPSNIENSKITATINPMSIQTAYPNPEKEDFDNVLATDKSWFNASKYTSIEFTSTSIEMTDENAAVMQGNLHFMGVSKPVSLDVTFNGAMPLHPFTRKATMGFSASTTITRSQFGMSAYLPHIGDEVEVMIEGEFIKTK